MTKNYTYLKFTDFVYVRLKGLIWSCNGLIKGRNLDIDAGDELNRIYLENPDCLIIDCRDVVNITDHSWDALFKSIKDSKREILFINASQLDDKINASYREFCSGTGLQKTTHQDTISIFHTIQKITPDFEFMRQVNSKIQEKIKNSVIKCFEENKDGEYEFLPSTPIQSTGQFNASNIISDPESFYWTCLRLADVVDEMIKQHRIGSNMHTNCLLAVSLRACPFACAISLLLDIKLETIDHFGPVTRVTDINKEVYQKTYEYIYIGDFVVGGTEIKISQTYALIKQSKCNYAVVIGSLHESSVYSGFMINNLVTLKSISPKAKFKLFHND